MTTAGRLLYNPIMEMSDFMTVKQAADFLGIGDQWVRDLIHEGRLKAIKLGRMWFIDRASVEAFERKKRGPQPQD